MSSYTDFTFRNEVQAGRSSRPHWPGGRSGLTLGPGYDIGDRAAYEVVRFLTEEIGATDGPGLRCFADAAGLKGDDARVYAEANRAALDALSITREQEERIFCALAPGYEYRVQRFLDRHHPGTALADLDDDQKCILFDYAYNVGLEKFPKFAAAVLARDWVAARAESRRGGLEGTRRERETYAFLDRQIGGADGAPPAV